MKCQEFQTNVDGLARGALSDARTRDAAAAHEAECEPCAARLADERALTAGLRALAASMRESEAPARAEAELLSAFKSRAAAAASVEGAAGTVSTSHAPSNPSNVVALSEHAGAKQLSWVKTVAVAAMAAAAAVALFMLVPPQLSTPAPPASRSVANNTRVVPVQTQGGVVTSAGQNDVAQSGEGQNSPTSKGGGSETQKLIDERVTPVTSTQRRGVVRGTLNASYGGTSRGVASNRNTPSETAAANEITTEFIPLAGFTQSEGVHLMRVELPRSALASFGIPVNADNAGGRVKADVLLGEDGTARAIRFVR